ncbi:unnamed protein product [Rhizoctonia solani]|uniref:Uncharacterized protein n=1 Tax=Rhizoctonia solani TaxID=456999 RepID=A0A8H3AYY0_9AGAM|nr:unnamed protein product [Rhizoctonia solani]
MNSVQLAPYNESMRLGQGYNSFLQLPRVHRAVTVEPRSITIDKAPSKNGVPQVVSYSSRLVSKLSEVTRTMNITSGASIKAGSITVSGNQTAIDETKFSAADINAVVSVKVINQTTRLDDNPQFNTIPGVDNDEKFHRVYGDTYISGFIEGGEFHSIISIRVLDSARKEQIISSLKQKLANVDPKSFTFNLKSSSAFTPEMKHAETSIFVNWCGGGQIKPAADPWTLETIFRAASAFPNKVALHPQYCWAILTRYTHNLSFHSALNTTLSSISVRSYANVNAYAADLLDDYMEYKANLLTIKKVLDEPIGYVLGPGSQPVGVRTEALVNARRKMKEEMGKIVKEIELLEANPSSLPQVMKNSTIESPEVWATRLPKRKVGQTTELESISAPQPNISNLLKLFNFANEAASKATEDLLSNTNPTKDEAPQKPPSSSVVLPILADESTQTHMTTSEKAFVNSPDNRRQYGPDLRFDKPGGTPNRSLNFNDAETIKDASVRATWPVEVTFQMVFWGDSYILGLCKVSYTQLNLSHGGAENSVSQPGITLRLDPGDRIVRLKIGFGAEVNRVKGVKFIELWVNPQGHRALGKEEDCVEFLDCPVPEGLKGLKGFYGYEQPGKVIERIGIIWGK